MAPVTLPSESRSALQHIALSTLSAIIVTAVAVMTSVEAGFSCLSSPCLHGICVDHINSSYSCFCVDGYTGLQCQTDWDECWSAPCQNGATCVDQVAALTCLCPSGYTGEFCESEINECLSDPCQNNGTCVDLLDHYLCTCPIGYSGVNCEVDVSVCNSSDLFHNDGPKCLHGGKCIDGPALSFTCDCPPGWSGKSCETDEDECIATPCLHASVCINTPGSFACACHFGYTGRLCEEALVFCEDNPCENGALCVMENNNATCYCVPDFHGSQCQDQYNDCLPYAPRCFNGGSCIDGIDSFMCSCPNATSGLLCECTSTADGEECAELPPWFDGKPFQPVGSGEIDIYHHWFSTTPRPPDVTEVDVGDTLPAPTPTEEYPLYSTKVIDYDFSSETLSPSFDAVTSVLESTPPRDPKDIPTESSVISAKETPGFPETLTASVPYSSSELFASFFPSTSMEWAESVPVLPSPVLPDLTSSPAFVDVPAASTEAMTTTQVPLVSPTLVLESSFSTAAPELISLSLVPELDVSTSPLLVTVAALDPTPAFLPSSSLLLVSPVPVDATDVTSIMVDVYNVTLVSVDATAVTSVTVDATDLTSVLVDTTVETPVPVDATASPPSAVDIGNATLPSDPLEDSTLAPGTELAITFSSSSSSLPSGPASTPEDVTAGLPTPVPETTDLPDNVTDYLREQDNATEPSFATEDAFLGSETPGFTYPYTPEKDINATDTVAPQTTTADVSTSDIPDTTIPTRTTTVDGDLEGNVTVVTRVTEVPSTTEFAYDNVTDAYTSTPPPHLTTTGVYDTMETSTGSEFTSTSLFDRTDFTTPTDIYVTYTDISDDFNITSPAPKDLTELPTSVLPDTTLTTDVFDKTTEYVDTIQTTVDVGLTAATTDIDSTSITPVGEATTIPISDATTLVTERTTMTVTDETTLSTGLLDTTEVTTTEATASVQPTDTTLAIDVPLSTEETSVSFTTMVTDVTEPTQTTSLSDIPSQAPTELTETTQTTAITDTTEYTPMSTTPLDAEATTTTTDTLYITSEAPLTLALTPDGYPSTQSPDVPTITTTTGRPTDTTTTKTTNFTTTPTLIDLFTVVTDAVVESVNVTIPEDELVYNVSLGESTTPLKIPLTTTTEIMTPESTTMTPAQTTDTQLPVTAISHVMTTFSPPPTTTTSETPTTTPQVPLSPAPTDALETDVPVKTPDYTASPSEKEPVFFTTTPPASTSPPLEVTPAKTLPPLEVTPSRTSPPPEATPVKTPPPLEITPARTTFPPFEVTPATTSETQSDQAPPAECGDGFCLNGGTCIDRDGKSSCKCPFNYKGAYCELYFYINKPYFVGASYLGVDVGNLSLRQGVQVYVQFTSQGPNGLVAYSEGPSDTFFMLLLRNSLLQFVFSCGLQTVSFLQGNDKLSANFRTDVSVRMWWTPYEREVPWGPGKCSASMQVNDTSPIYSEQRASSAFPRLGHVYLGGLPSSYSSPLVVKAGFLPRLQGCVSILEVNGREVDTWLSGVAGESVQECGTALCPPGSCLNGGSCVPGPAVWSCNCPPGYHGELCERTECVGGSPCHSGQCITSALRPNPLCVCPPHRYGLYCELERVVQRPSYGGTVEGYSSYSVYKVEEDITLNLALRLHFTTDALRQVGLIAYLGNSVRSSTRDFLALSLVRGHLMLTWDLGAGPRRVMTTDALDGRLHTHTALLVRRGKTAWLKVDTQENVTSTSPGYLASLNTNNLLYIGGHPSWNMTHLPADMWRHEGFRGCVFDLRVARELSGPWTALRVAGAANVRECGEDVCSEDSCKNGGTCISVGATYRCHCTVGWKGPRCTIASHVCEGGRESCAPGASCLSAVSSGDGPTCLCQVGRTGPRCEKAINITDPHFSGLGSYLTLRAPNLRKETRITVSFRPESPDGILILAVPRKTPGDFLALVLVNGTLQFTYRLGWRAPGLTLLRSRDAVVTGEWQSVTVTRRGGDGSLFFRGHTTTAGSSDPKANMLDVHSQVYVGGVPDYSGVPAVIAPSTSRIAFRGCIKEVTINDHDFDLRTPNDGEVLQGAGLNDCDGTACGRHVCLHGGTCTPAGDTYVCSCTEDYTGARCQLPRACLDHSCINGGTCIPLGSPTKKKKRRQSPGQENETSPRYLCLCPPGYVGERCEQMAEVSALKFSGRSFAVIPQGPFGSPVPHKDSYALNFSTASPHGLMLWRGTPDDPAEDFLGVGVDGGRIKVVWHLGGGGVGRLLIEDRVMDRAWHSLVVTRAGAVVTVYLNGRAHKAKSPGTFTQLNDETGAVYVGGFPTGSTVASATDGHFLSPYIGCLRGVTVHEGSSPVRFSSLPKGQDLQPCF